MGSERINKRFILTLVLISIFTSAYPVAERYLYKGNYIYYNPIGDGKAEITHNSYYYGMYKGDIEIPDSINNLKVVSIGSDTFTDCKLTSLKIPKTIERINCYAFQYCHQYPAIVYIDDIESWCKLILEINSNGYAYSSPIDSYTKLYLNGGELTDLVVPQSVSTLVMHNFANLNFNSISFEDSDEPITIKSSNGDLKCSFNGIQDLYIGRDLAIESPLLTENVPLNITIGEKVKKISGQIVEKESSNSISLKVKSLAAIPPELSDHLSISELEVPYGMGPLYSKTVFWRNAPVIYSSLNGKKNIPVIIEVNGENIVSVNGGFEDHEMPLNSDVSVAFVQGYNQGCLVYHNGKDITEILKNAGKYTFKVSDYYGQNTIRTFSFQHQTIHLENAGDLISKIGIDNIESIESLKISGELNGTDILTIRKMTNLKILDLKECTIVGGGMSYYQDYTTSFNTIGAYFFKDKTNLSAVVLPLNITSIKEKAFEGMSNLKAISIPSTVTDIETEAFEGCTELEDLRIEIAGNELRLNKNIFKDCPIKTLFLGRQLSAAPFAGSTTLLELTIGNGMSTIGNYDFEECPYLHTIRFPNSLSHIGSNAFYGCTAIKNVYISDLKYWCDIEFENNKSNPCYYSHSLILNGKLITDLNNIPANTEKIGNYAFVNCDGITSVTIPNKVKTIGKGAFENCTAIKNVIVPNNVTTIGDKSFSDCNSLETLKIGEGVKKIGKGAFKNAYKLTNVVIPNTVTEIGDSAFAHCSNVTNLIIGANVVDIMKCAFYGCNLSSITIPNKVKNIRYGAFSENKNLSYLHIDYGTETLTLGCDWLPLLEYSSFSGCNIKDVYLGRPLNTATEEHGIRPQMREGYSYYLLEGLDLKSVTIANTVNYLDGYFQNSSIEKLIIEDGDETVVMRTNAYYMEECRPFYRSKIRTLYLGRNVNLWNPVLNVTKKLIFDSNLSSLTIGPKVTEISSQLFEYCSGLTSVEIPGNIKTIGSAAFDECTGIVSLTIHEGVKIIEDAAFRLAPLNKVVIPSSVVSIGDRAFASCNELSDVVFNEGLTEIGDMAFSGCESIETIVIPNSVTSIGNRAFYDLKKLKDMTLGNNVTIIGDRIFSGCTSLSSIMIPNSLISIGERAFENCTNLKHVDLSENLIGIGPYMFDNCTKLDSIIIPNSVDSIAEFAFNGCSALRYVSIGKNATLLKELAFNGCDNISEIYSLNPTPPKIVETTFSDVIYQNANLYVTEGSRNRYWLHPYWENFVHIEEINTEEEDISEKKAMALIAYKDGMDVYDHFNSIRQNVEWDFYLKYEPYRLSNRLDIDSLCRVIEDLLKKVSESSMSDEKKASYTETLEDIYSDIVGILKDNDDYDYWGYVKYEIKPQFESYYERLGQYKERIDKTKTNDELNAIITEIEDDAANMESSYLNLVEDFYNRMLENYQHFILNAEKLSKYKLQINELDKEINDIITDIDNILMSDSFVSVVNMKGEKMVIKSSQIKSLLKGIYIINGKKVLIK